MVAEVILTLVTNYYEFANLWSVGKSLFLNRLLDLYIFRGLVSWFEYEMSINSLH